MDKSDLQGSGTQNIDASKHNSKELALLDLIRTSPKTAAKISSELGVSASSTYRHLTSLRRKNSLNVTGTINHNGKRVRLFGAKASR